jgi:hypothetical protein
MARANSSGDTVVRLHANRAGNSRDVRREPTLGDAERERLAKLATKIVADWPPLSDDERGRLRNLLGRQTVDRAAKAA